MNQTYLISTVEQSLTELTYIILTSPKSSHSINEKLLLEAILKDSIYI